MLAVGFFRLLHGLGKRHAHGAPPQVPLHLQNALDMLQHAPVDLIQVPDAGRGLAASESLPQGTSLHTEKPMLCYPSTKHIGKVCHHCLTPVADAEHTSPQSKFCSSTCKQDAVSAYHCVESALDLGPLLKYCKQYEERFPLLVARAACMHLSQSLPTELSHKSNSGAARIPQGDVWQDYKFLTFARIPPPAPPPWVETHALLQAAITAFVKQQAEHLPEWQQRSLTSAAAELDLEWYTSMLARLHINSFRVDGVLMSGQQYGMSLADMASAAVTGQQQSSLGTAVYLLASLFNHSCSPNVDVTFPANNSTSEFVAARDIDVGEQLSISYIDATMSYASRQQQLEWAYGFRCTCDLCTEEMPPQQPA